MESSATDEFSGTRTRRRPGRLWRLTSVIALAAVVALAGFGVYTYLATHTGQTTIVVYTYDSLFGGGCGENGSAAVLAPFEKQFNVQFDLECPVGTLASTLIAQKNAPAADLVIGLDEITGPQADAAGVLQPYVSPELADVSPSLVNSISPDHSVTPYEWGYLGLDYCPAFDQATDGAIATSSFPSLVANSTWAHNLILEDPTVDIVGEEYLLSEIAFYQSVLHQSWTPWWSSVHDDGATVADSWDTAFDEFTCAAGTPQLVSSFLTDPAYADYYGTPGAYNSTVSHWNGTQYGWQTIYGVGIVRGSTHVALDEAFINWMLQGQVQSFIPTSEWEYPANTTITLPPSYAFAPNPASVTPLNPAIPPSSIAAN
ncbi:MAG: thiamine ABC transporter substrate-binding protein, partial [Thermoplasmata archaeon]|nr:thiamine ABC transporter substrate-binding protein [Thermoplasmata archaeon]